MPASFHHFTANVTPNITTKITAERIIRHTGPSVKTHPEFGFLSGTAFSAAGSLRGRETIAPYHPSHSLDARHGPLVPGNANLPIGVFAVANREIGVPKPHTPQCLKCRTPQKTMAMPSRSAAAMTSASRTEPPG